MLTGQCVCWTIKEKVFIVFWGKKTKWTYWCVVPKPVGIWPTKSKSQVGEQETIIATAEFIIIGCY